MNFPLHLFITPFCPCCAIRTLLRSRTREFGCRIGPFAIPKTPPDSCGPQSNCMKQVFRRRPRGLWPSEGRVSDEVLRLAAREGFAWAATDEGVLASSIHATFSRRPDGTLEEARELYRPHRFSCDSQQISIFFRDHFLSDLIGFAYCQHAGAGRSARPPSANSKPLRAARATAPGSISIILDGENAWEYFPGNGREFLKAFIRKLWKTLT